MKASQHVCFEEHRLQKETNQSGAAYFRLQNKEMLYLQEAEPFRFSQNDFAATGSPKTPFYTKQKMISTFFPQKKFLFFRQAARTHNTCRSYLQTPILFLYKADRVFHRNVFR